MRLIVKLLVFTLLVGSLQSCVSKKKFDELTAAKMATDQALAETQTNLKNLQSEKDALEADFASTKADLNAKLSDLQSKYDTEMGNLNKELTMTKSELAAVKAKIDGIFSTYSNSGLSLQEQGGRLYVTTSTPVKFRSSSARLNRDQRAAIDALAETLKANPAVKILIEGNTDDRKFKAGTGSDNWDLSYRRAKAVASRLIRKGVDPAQLAVVGRADAVPVADNSTKEGRAENRRTVILPNPDLGVLKN